MSYQHEIVRGTVYWRALYFSISFVQILKCFCCPASHIARYKSTFTYFKSKLFTTVVLMDRSLILVGRLVLLPSVLAPRAHTHTRARAVSGILQVAGETETGSNYNDGEDNEEEAVDDDGQDTPV